LNLKYKEDEEELINKKKTRIYDINELYEKYSTPYSKLPSIIALLLSTFEIFYFYTKILFKNSVEPLNWVGLIIPLGII
jgi:hypothetical protein